MHIFMHIDLLINYRLQQSKHIIDGHLPYMQVKLNKYVIIVYLHHILEDITLCVSVALSVRFADDAVVLEEENMAVVASGG